MIRRSRQDYDLLQPKRDELWIKGETSGHYQYVKDLYIDCDRDTLLAKVKQIGAACHTGNYSCFYTDLLEKED